MGVSVDDAEVKILSTKLGEREPLLITHWGLSGPAVLRLSAWGARELNYPGYDFKIQVNRVPAYHENSLRDFIYSFRDGAGSHAE